MRAGPLSKDNVIEALNRYFIPAYVSDEDYGEHGTAPAEEKAEFRRVFREAAEAKLSVGTVHAYVLSPDGHVVDSLHVAKAAAGDNLIQMLQRTVERFHTPAGEPVVKPHPQSACPAPADRDALVLHLTARTQGTDPSHHGGWDSFPSENWIILSEEQWRKLLPDGPANIGLAWDVDPSFSDMLLRYFYPQTENNDVATNRIDRQSFRATIVSKSGDTVRAQLDGSLRMKHTFYPHKEDGNFVEAKLTGYVEFDAVSRKVTAIKLVTDQATYASRPFDAALVGPEHRP